MSNLYRLYIDESGTHHYSTRDSVDKRYLGLTGIIVEVDAYTVDFQPRIDKIKKLFSRDPDNLPILHREDIINKRGVFGQLNEPAIENQFNSQLLDLTKNVAYCVCAVVIDKKSHLDKYQKSAEHPYHYCLKTMLERYLHFLMTRGKGDVMAESRGKVEDIALKQVYDDFYHRGTYFCTKDYVQSYLTSKEIKIKNKDRGIAGLEFADLLSLATKLDVLSTYGVIPALTDNFNKTVTTYLQPKYCRGNNNQKIKGYGKKLL
ncbi:MAG: hypothetical protein G01um101416_904 [Microgenomates group bacterium Gr01-1014_16]|nr:MAG: hypothetical protein G01um101416_904 [Microgenomates group bacterium Gr01-1014_16]